MADGDAGDRIRPDPGLPRTLIGGVGYHDLRDFSVGPGVARSLGDRSWPAAVEVRSLGYGPVDVVHRLEWAEPPVERWILVGAVRRGRPPGTVTAYRWDGSLPDDEEIQARVGEAVTGVVGLENLLVVTAAFGAIPPVSDVIEVEPEVEELGRTLTPAVERAAARASERARELALIPPAEARIPTAPIGGFGAGNGRAGPEGVEGAEGRHGAAGSPPADGGRPGG